MTDIDPLGVDAVLVVFGTVYGLLAGASLLVTEPPPVVPAFAAGLALPFVFAAVIRRIRIGRLDEWVSETRRGREAILVCVTVLLAGRFALAVAPQGVQNGFEWWLAGTCIGLVALGLGRATHRAVSGRTEREASER